MSSRIRLVSTLLPAFRLPCPAVPCASVHSLSSKMDPRTSRVTQSRPLANEDAKWIGLRAIEWTDPSGKARVWESADRRTRKSEVDAVAILTVIKRPSVEPHILLVTQFRPPVGACVVELPAGLVDAGEDGDEGAKRAALRELEEETGYGAASMPGATVSVQSLSDVMYNDPGLTGANMKLCVIHIELSDDASEPIARPDEGEYIDKHLVPLASLVSQLQAFKKQGYEVDARLSHIAAGIELGSGLVKNSPST